MLAMIFLFIACQRQSTKEFEQEISFKNYVKLLPQITLPYYFACDSSFMGSPLWWAKIDYTDTLVKKFSPKYSMIVGKIYESDQSIGVLYTFAADVALPIIVITDTMGVNKGAVELYELGNCVVEDHMYDSYSSIIQGQITQDLQVVTSLEVINCDTVKCDTVWKHLTKRISPSGKVQVEK